MKAVVTICSKEKDHTTKDISAYQRYKSPRIGRIKSIAEQKGLPFFILSGEYGLIAADDTIPYYDHLLKESEIPTLASLAVRQSRSLHITAIEFYAKPRQKDWELYYQVIERLTDVRNIKLAINLI